MVQATEYSDRKFAPFGRTKWIRGLTPPARLNELSWAI